MSDHCKLLQVNYSVTLTDKTTVHIYNTGPLLSPTTCFGCLNQP